MNETGVSVVVTGTVWMGGGIGSIESALERLFREAEQEIVLTAYTISSSTDRLFNWLETVLTRGVQVRMIINRLNTQPPEVVGRLHQLVSIYPHFHLYNFVSEGEGDLHAKAIVADRRLALVGSSNLSRRGLLTNHELAVLVYNVAAADVARALDLLCASQYAVRMVDCSVSDAMNSDWP